MQSYVTSLQSPVLNYYRYNYTISYSGNYLPPRSIWGDLPKVTPQELWGLHAYSLLQTIHVNGPQDGSLLWMALNSPPMLTAPGHADGPRHTEGHPKVAQPAQKAPVSTPKISQLSVQTRQLELLLWRARPGNPTFTRLYNFFYHSWTMYIRLK